MMAAGGACRLGRAGLQASVNVVYFFHPERALVREAIAIQTFSATADAHIQADVRRRV